MLNKTKRTLIVTGLVIGAVTSAVFAVTWVGCWNEFEENAALCCDMPSPEAKKACLDGEVESLGICLNQLGQGSPQPDCHKKFRELIIGCDREPPCGLNDSVSRDACFAAARAFLRWCRGRGASAEILDTTPTWDDPPDIVDDCDTEIIVVGTNDLDIVGVRFVAFRPDADPSDPDATFVLGDAESQALGGEAVAWTLSTDTCHWPIDINEEAVLIWAEAMINEGGSRAIWDNSDPIRVAIDR